MSKNEAQNQTTEVEASISIIRYKDPTVPFKVTISGNWTMPQLMAIQPLCIKYNRRRIADIMREAQKKATLTEQHEGE